MIGFGRSRVPRYTSSSLRTPMSAVNPPSRYQSTFARSPDAAAVPMGMTPQMPSSAPALNGMAATMAPLPAATPDNRAANFQNSLNRERGENARSAQIFAASAPLPKDDASSAFGSVAQSQAARDAYVDKMANRSDAATGGAYTSRSLTLDANARQNATNAAGVDLVGSQAEGNRAVTSQIVPAEAGKLTAEGGAITSNTKRLDDMAPLEQDQMREGTYGQSIANDARAAGIPFIKPTLQQGLDEGKVKLQGEQQEQGLKGQFGAPLMQSQLNKSAAETGLINRSGYQVPEQAADPNADLDRQKKQIDINKAAGRDDLNEGILGAKPAPWYMRAAMASPSATAILGSGPQAATQSAMQGGKPAAAGVPAGQSGGAVTPELAKQFLQQAGGDKNKAREMARKAGYTF